MSSAVESAALDVISPEVVSAAAPLRMALTPEEVRQWVAQVDEMRRAVLQAGSDYDTIPGTSKPSLFKPGAEKLLMWAGLGFTMDRVDDEHSRTMSGVTYKCTVHRGSTDNIVAQCDGYAGYDEDRFYQSEEDAKRKERALSEQYERAPRPAKMVGYRSPWNSVMKMAEKRALVGATLNATATSGLFTQDLEDEPRGLWDPGAAVLPQIQILTEDERKDLTAWRKREGLPSLPELTSEQGVAVGVQIGLILADRRSVEPQSPESASEGADDQAVQSDPITPSDEPTEGPAAPVEPTAALQDARESLEQGKAKLDDLLAKATPTREDDVRSSVARTPSPEVSRQLAERGYDPGRWSNVNDRRAALVNAILADDESPRAE